MHILRLLIITDKCLCSRRLGSTPAALMSFTKSIRCKDASDDQSGYRSNSPKAILLALYVTFSSVFFAEYASAVDVFRIPLQEPVVSQIYGSIPCPGLPDGPGCTPEEVTNSQHAAVDYSSAGSRVLATSGGRVTRLTRNSPNNCKVDCSGIDPIRCLCTNDGGCSGKDCECDDEGFGNTVTLQHTLANGQGVETGETIYSQYSHLGSFRVDLSENECVQKGELLGYTGASAYGRDPWKYAVAKVGGHECKAMGAHLHFEMKNGPQLTDISRQYRGYTPTPGPPDNFGYRNPDIYTAQPSLLYAKSCESVVVAFELIGLGLGHLYSRVGR